MERRPTSRNVTLSWLEPSPNSISPHLIQNTYARLKLQYSDTLHKTWTEDLESPTQVLEHLSLAACLIELWRKLYNAVPVTEQSSSSEHESKTTAPIPFPGFVDLACGNGILVYILLMEGYQGVGYDACHRKSWATFPDEVKACLKERIIVPSPFADVLGLQEGDFELESGGVEIHTGRFPKGTFIISDHADELTVWTPFMAALACPGEPKLPFLVVPCCSKTLAGREFRYPPEGEGGTVDDTGGKEGEWGVEQNAQPESGDLKALRAIKLEERTEAGFWKSMAGSLAAKTRGVAEEIGFGVERAWLRTPGAVNMALIGGWRGGTGDFESESGREGVLLENIRGLVERECVKDGGVEGAAKLWVERIRSLRQGQGRVH
ncbi:tRNA (uracil-O(2)-)-methyltransferase [Penicillium sp. DV-2018c]|nr:tRNA (uracil-O(2)-)-methyltransferase [Penicillium sp. DV-2018c]